MNNSTLREILDNAKLSLDCRDFLNLRCSEGHAICAPDFIRTDDHHPSFAVWKDHCFDFAQNGGQYYDIFDLKMLRDDQSLPEAFLDLTGHPLYTPKSHEEQKIFDAAQFNLQKLHSDIKRWNEALLADPIINFNGQQVHLLSEYVAKRGINSEFCRKFLIGYSREMHRLVFPCFKNGKPTAWCARELNGQSLPKYLKPKLDDPDNFGFEIVPWGLNTLRDPRKRSAHQVMGDDGVPFDEPYNNPKDYTLVIAEGAFDWASFAQEGWQVISPMGGHFRKQLYPFLVEIAKPYKQVLICFDNDNAGQSFQKNLCELFFRNRIKFICGHTKNPDGSQAKFDVNDYYSNGGSLDILVKNAVPGLVELANFYESTEQISDMLEQSARFASAADLSALRKSVMMRVKPNPDFHPDMPEGPANKSLIPAFDADVIKDIFREAKSLPPELKIADEVLAKHRIIYNYNDQFYHYRDGRWQVAAEAEIIGFILNILGKKATNGKARAIMKDLQSVAGQWAQFDTKHVIAFTNGVLDLEKGQFFKHSPEFMNTIKLNYPYKPLAMCPRWRKFIHEVSKGNQALITQLQKAVGYVLFADNSLQKMFCLFGSGANGKSVFTGTIEQVFGKENTSHVRPDRLNSDFEGIHTQGKLLNICSEAKRKMNDSEEILKAFISGDPVMSAHKGVDSVTFTSRAKWFINMNNVMETTDISWGFMRRLIFLPFNASFNGADADPDLQRKLLDELPGIFNWAYEGYKLLREDMKFEELEEATKLLEQMQAQVNSSFSFFCDSFRGNANDYLVSADSRRYYPTSNDIYSMYKDWCKENEEKPETKKLFLERFKVFIQKYRQDVVISEPYHEEGVRGKIVKFYFPEFYPENEPDFFASRRDPDTGEYIDLDDHEDMDTATFMEVMQECEIEQRDIDEQKAKEEAERYAALSQEEKDIEDGRKLFLEACKKPANWHKTFTTYQYEDCQKSKMLAAMDAWIKLRSYLLANPGKALFLKDFANRYIEITSLRLEGKDYEALTGRTWPGEMGDTSAQ